MRRLPCLLAGCAGLLPSCGSAKITPLDLPARADEPAALLAAAPEQPPAEPFAFPADSGGPLLAKLLVPGGGSLGSQSRAPLVREPPSGVERPVAPLPQTFAVPARLPRPATTVVRPRSLAEVMPLADVRFDTPPPLPLTMPSGWLVKQDPVPNVPPALPPTAQSAPGRASLDDPTAEFSAQSVRTKQPPARTTPLPFQKAGIPDPFENAKDVKLKALLPSDPLTDVPAFVPKP